MAVTPLSLSISSTKFACNLSVKMVTGQYSYLRCVKVNLSSSHFPTWVMIGQTYRNTQFLQLKFLVEDKDERLSLGEIPWLVTLSYPAALLCLPAPRELSITSSPEKS